MEKETWDALHITDGQTKAGLPTKLGRVVPYPKKQDQMQRRETSCTTPGTVDGCGHLQLEMAVLNEGQTPIHLWRWLMEILRPSNRKKVKGATRFIPLWRLGVEHFRGHHPSHSIQKKDHLQFSGATPHISPTKTPILDNLSQHLQAVHEDATWVTKNTF